MTLTNFLFYVLFLTNISIASANDSILYIGDSQSAGHLGPIIHSYLKEKNPNQNIKLFGISSSSPRHWADNIDSKNGSWLCSKKGRFNDQFNISLEDKICKGEPTHSAFHYLNKDRPDYVIFQFLGNSIGFNENFINKKIKTLLAELKNQNCLFITSPPYYADLEDRNLIRLKTESFFIKAIGSRCEIVRGMTRTNMDKFSTRREYYGADKVHLTKLGADTFFQQIKLKLP
jgi:hypothetical protein